MLLAYKPRVRQWVQYDDTSVKAVGDWGEVEKRCKAGRFQYVVNPKPEIRILNPKSETRSPKPETRNPAAASTSSTLDTEP